jgi:hypothetical protein
MKRFTVVKLFLSLAILVLIGVFSRLDVARAQQNWNGINVPTCRTNCKLICFTLPSGKQICDCFCPPPPVD